MIKVIKVFKIIIGSVALISVFISLIFLSNDILSQKYAFLITVCGTFIFLMAAGKIKQPLYVLIIPAMMLPYVFNLYLDYDTGKGEIIGLLMIGCGFIASKMIDTYYKKRG